MEKKKKDEETEVRGEVRQKKSRHGGAGDGGGGDNPVRGWERRSRYASVHLQYFSPYSQQRG